MGGYNGSQAIAITGAWGWRRMIRSAGGFSWQSIDVIHGAAHRGRNVVQGDSTVRLAKPGGASTAATNTTDSSSRREPSDSDWCNRDYELGSALAPPGPWEFQMGGGAHHDAYRGSRVSTGSTGGDAALFPELELDAGCCCCCC